MARIGKAILGIEKVPADSGPLQRDARVIAGFEKQLCTGQPSRCCVDVIARRKRLTPGSDQIEVVLMPGVTGIDIQLQ